MTHLRLWTSRLFSTKARWLGLAAVLTFALVTWEYLLNAMLNPGADWNVAGIGAHMALDMAVVFPLLTLALAAGLKLARRWGVATPDMAGLFGIAGLVCLLFMGLMLPVNTSRDVAHDWMGTTFSLPIAQVQTTEVRSNLTVQQATQLCSFGSLRDPSRADGSVETALVLRLVAGTKDLLIQLAAFMPLLLLGLYARRRSVMAQPNFGPAVTFLRWWAKPMRFGAVCVAVVLGFCFGNGIGLTDNLAYGNLSAASATGSSYNACTDGGPVREYRVHAIHVDVTLNRWADHHQGYMYALEADLPAIAAFEADLIAARNNMVAADDVNLPGQFRVTPGLGKDPIQPLVLRANLGDCLRVHFTNDLTDGPASMHILGLAHTANNAGGAVGNNPISYAAMGATVTYEIPIPLATDAERAYSFYDQAGGRARQKFGMFGALVVEPKGSVYLDAETGAPLTGSAWEAIILDPNLDGRPDGKSFREFVLIYHEIGDEAQRPVLSFDGEALPLLDPGTLSGVYRPGARAINYRSEPFRRRIEFDSIINGTAIKNGKSLGYASYPYGDPATPIPRSYVGEATKTRLLHAGSEVFHVHHLHGGGDRWRRNPNADPNSNFWKGLTKVPQQKLTSVHLDSQSIGPGSSYNLEHECGAGGCQQGVGEFLYHCHIGHHYIAGMWSFWRVFGTVQTAETNFNGRPLYVEPALFQADNPFSDTEAPSNTPPQGAVSAGALLGLKVDWNRTIVANVTNPLTQVSLTDWIRNQLPPQGVPIDNDDATVWDWTLTGSGASLQAWGEPEETFPFAGYESASPGVRPEILFNPKNGRYTWPLFRPHAAARPPFSARHSGSPWLGEEMIPGRIDGVCANNFVHPAVSVGLTSKKRWYPISSITLPIQVTEDRTDPDGMIFVLNEDETDVRNGLKPAEPLAIRSNVGDCVEVIFTNKIPDGPLNRDFSKTNIHSHFVQFDTQASDGVVSGFSYEQAVRPLQNENRTLTADTGFLSNTLKVTNTDRLRPGIWIGVGLGEGTCGHHLLTGEPLPCTEIRKIASIPDPNTIKLDLPLLRNHSAGEAVGVEFVRYNWYPDVDFGTVFFHTHVEFKDWDRGLFGAHITEPKTSTYHDPVTGDEIRSGTLADIRVNLPFLAEDVATGVNKSFREFVLFLQDNNPVEGQFRLGGGTINLRAEPWRLRPGDPAYRFSSVMHGDPHTQEVRAYVGDPLVVRGMGLIERVGGIRFTGHRFNIERYTDKSDIRDTTFLGISERYDFALEGGAGGPGGFPGDYLYYSTIARDFSSGGWGLLRVYDSAQPDLQPLPGYGTPNGESGFPQLSETGSAPPSLTGAGNGCPAHAPRREYSLAVDDTTIIYNDVGPIADATGVAFHLDGAVTPETRTPMVLRVNKGECLRVNLRNLRDTQRSGFSVGELRFDPQRSYGSAIGLNHDSTVAPGAVRTYEYYADKDLGLVLALDLGDVDAVPRGSYAGVVVEPSGSTYHQPGSASPLPGGGTGIQADIIRGGQATREFVALVTDLDTRLGQNTMPYPAAVAGLTGHSYSAEPLSLRGLVTAPADMFRSDLHGDPRHVVTVPAGADLVYRVGVVWTDQMHLVNLAGHSYYQEPGMAGSEAIYTDVMAPGMTLNFNYLGGAGGDLQAQGDYLFGDRRQPFMEAGLWSLLRVTDPFTGSAAAPDSIMVTHVEGVAEGTAVRGVVSTLPAGHTVRSLAVFDGVRADGACSGRLVARVPVNPGSGRWEFTLPAGVDASQVCIRSRGGAVVSGHLDGNLVSDRAHRLPEVRPLKAQEISDQVGVFEP